MLALLFPVPKKCRRPYLGCNSCLGGQFRANLVLEIAYSAEFSLYFSLFLGESSSLVTASSAIKRTVALELEKSPFRFRRVIARLFITVLSQLLFELPY